MIERMRRCRRSRILVAGPTLRLTIPSGGTLLLAGAMLIFLIGSLEYLARLDSVRDVLPPPGVGADHRPFEIQLARLERLEDEGLPTDCIFLGDSSIHSAVNPSVFMPRYEAASGEPIRCFNFGVGGLTVQSAAILSKILLSDYEPRLLVYGLDIARLGQFEDNLINNWLRTSAWVQHKQGRSNLEGWLIEHSNAYRYFLPYRNWMRKDYMEIINQQTSEGAGVDRYGYLPRQQTMESIAEDPNPIDEPRYFERFANFEVSKNQIKTVLQMAADGHQEIFVVLEMPLHRTYYSFFPRGRDDYESALVSLENALASNGVPFVATSHLDLFPDGMWINRNHLNSRGALVFSEWLAQELAFLLN